MGKNTDDTHFIFRLQNWLKKSEEYQKAKYALYEEK